MDFIDEIYRDKDLSLLKKLTLVIPTYNRNYYLSRCLWYHAHFPFGQIIVADSSPDEKKVINRDTVSNIREMFGSNILYLEYEPETDKYGGDIHKKWGDAIQHVKTEYSQSCTDKEFLIPTTSCKCIEYLYLYSDYSIAEGMNYQLLDDIWHRYKIVPWQSEISLNICDLISRLEFYRSYKTAIGTQFAVRRANEHKQIFNNLVKYNIFDIRFGELAIEVQPVIIGKTKKFNDICGCCRDSIHRNEQSIIKPMSNKSESSYLRYPFINEYSEDRYKELSFNLKRCLQDEIFNSCNQQISDDFLDKMIDSMIGDRYINKGYKNKLLREHYFLQFLWERFPITLKHIISVKFGEGIAEGGIPNSKITPELKCILNIIKSTSEYYGSDKPIANVNIVR